MEDTRGETAFSLASLWGNRPELFRSLRRPVFEGEERTRERGGLGFVGFFFFFFSGFSGLGEFSSFRDLGLQGPRV